MKYDFKSVEAKWQKDWQDEHTFHAEIDHAKPMFSYILKLSLRISVNKRSTISWYET